MADEELPPLADNSDSDEDGYEEMDEEDQTDCLFCPKTLLSLCAALDHLKTDHQFSFATLKGRFNMDQYSYIKVINYIRTHNSAAAEFTDAKMPFWKDDMYLKPVKHESWLMYDFEDLEAERNIDDESDGVDHELTISKKLYRELERQNAYLKEQNEMKDHLLQQASQDILKMRESFNYIVEKELTKPQQQCASRPVAENCVAAVRLEDDEGYFSTYAHFSIHHDMLNDEVRTVSYRDAILGNKETFKDKVVLDLGCGTAILSMFAASAGAKNVISIDQSDIIYHAMEITRTNKFDNITLIKGRLEDTEIPNDKVDIIVSEWMGYFLLFEGMLDSVIYARDRHLKPGGIIMPNRCNISLVGFGNEQRYAEFVTFWQSVYGFDMSCMKKEVLKEAYVEICDPNYILTEPNVIAEFDLMTVDVRCPNFSFNFELKVLKAGLLTSLVGYFDTFFDLPNHIEFSTGPKSKSTHWKQVIFYLDKPIAIDEGQSIVGKFICERDRKDVRALIVRIEMNGKTMKYNLN